MSNWRMLQVTATYGKEGTDKLIHVEWNGSEIVHATDNEAISEEEYRRIVESFKKSMVVSSNIDVA